MRLEDEDQGSNIEDRRGSGGRGRRVSGIGIGTVAIVLIGELLHRHQPGHLARATPRGKYPPRQQGGLRK